MMNNYPNNRIILALFSMVIVSLFFGARQVGALSLTPVRVEISGNPGETVTQEISLINENAGSETFYSSFANFEASGDTGNPSFVEPKNDIGTWMSAPGVVTLGPNASQTVNLTIKIPNDATAGGHFGAIFWGTSPNTPGSGVAIGAKTGVLVLLSVNGDVEEAGGLVDFDTKDNKIFYNTLPVSFVYRFRNDGGDRIKPVGKITMRDLLYIPEDRIDANPTSGNILPKSTRRFDVDWVKNPREKGFVAPDGKVASFFDTARYQWRNFAVGPYWAQMSLLYGTEAIRVSKTAFFFVFPWQLLLCLAVIITIVLWGGKKLIKRYNRHIIAKARVGMSASHTADHA